MAIQVLMNNKEVGFTKKGSSLAPHILWSKELKCNVVHDKSTLGESDLIELIKLFGKRGIKPTVGYNSDMTFTVTVDKSFNSVFGSIDRYI
jgi:hypothetical protein